MVVKCQFFIAVFLWVCINVTFAQPASLPRDYRFFEIKGHSGNHLYTGKSLREALKNGYGSLEVRYGWQSSNANGWQRLYGYPAYGFGWYSGFIGNPDLLGTPNALYGFISFPVFTYHRHQMVMDPALGICYDLKHYDAVSDSINDAIGSRFNVYFNLNIGGKYRLTREVDLLYGLDFTHFSNGRIFKPNAGLNMWGGNLGIRYHFNIRQNKIDNSEFPSVLLNARPVLTCSRKANPIRRSDVSFYVAGGLVQNDEDKGTNRHYGTFTSFLEYRYLLNEKSAFTLGTDLFYDSSLEYLDPDRSFVFFGAHAGYDLLFWKLTIRIQAGTYLQDKGHTYKGAFFMRPALRFDFCKRLFIQLGLKTMDGFKADWVEFGMGMRLFRF